MFEKLIERVMCNRLKLCLKKNNILCKYQFGFRENQFTAHALIDLMEYINTCLDQGKYVFGIYIDLKKAFDTVQHDVLLLKSQHYGIRGKKHRIGLALFRLGSSGTIYAGGAHCTPLCFSFICGPITTKLGMMVLWDKISQNP